MFVPVACLKCGKPFQVPPAAAGTDVPCPWCKEATPALPVVLNVGTPPPTTPIPLAPPTPLAPPPASPPPASAAPELPPPAVKAVGSPLLIAGVIVVASVALGAGTYFAVKWYRAAHPVVSGTPDEPKVPLADAPWGPFFAPDGSWSADLPGPPTKSRLPLGVGGPGEQFVAADPRSGWAAWVAWRDLDHDWAAKAASKSIDKQGSDHPRFLLGPLFDAERARLTAEWDAAETGRRTIWEPLTVEVQMDGRAGKLVERMIVAPGGAKPRVYFVGLTAPDLDPHGPIARRLFDSFRVRQ